MPGISIVLPIRTISANFTRKGIWSLVVATWYLPIVARNGRTMPPARVTVVEPWALVRMAARYERQYVYEYQTSLYCCSIIVYQVLIIYTTYVNSQYLVSSTWYIPGTWYCFPAHNYHVITCAARQPRVRQKCTLSSEQFTIILWIHTVSTNSTRKSIWFLMRNVVGTRTYPILALNGRTMPPARVTVVESWGLVMMAMNGCMRTSYIYEYLAPDEK